MVFSFVWVRRKSYECASRHPPNRRQIDVRWAWQVDIEVALRPRDRLDERHGRLARADKVDLTGRRSSAHPPTLAGRVGSS
jgi:hypothetical protein